jgi:murein L,D-transpeptidase YcbB/YkuD
LDVEFPGGRESTGLSARDALTQIENAYTLLSQHYANAMVYTSARVWHEELGNLDSELMASAPLWIKTPYVYKAGNKPHPETAGKVSELPKPWQRADSAGAWIHQYQGDAKGYPGFTSTVDCNQFLTYSELDDETRQRWVSKQLARHNTNSVVVLQHVRGLTPDGIIGPQTFAALTYG